MSTPIFIHAKKYIRPLKRIAVVSFLFFGSAMHAGWNVDFSRRQEQMPSSKSAELTEKTLGASGSSANSSSNVYTAQADKSLFDRVFDSVVPTQDIVVLNTEQGFVPATIRVKEGAQYRIVVVNVNEKSRNVSFVLDSFSEHHATYYGQIKSFFIQPKKEGVYSYISPETSAQGRLIVYPAKSDGAGTSEVNVRTPASAE